MVTTNDSLAIFYTRVNTPEKKRRGETAYRHLIFFFLYGRSLEEMTQEGLEEIFAQYAQTIEAFRTTNTNTAYHVEEEVIEEEDNEWEDQQEEKLEEESKKTQSTGSSSSIFSQPNMTISAESLEARGPSPLSDKPLPASPTMSDDVAKQARRKSGFSGNKNRLSWTSDTGVTSSVVSQNLANQIMSLFDMDFAVDIKIDTAPKLPELPFKATNNKVQSRRRSSQDMLTSLLPAFEKIAFENSSTKSQLNKNLYLEPRQKQTTAIQSVPKRSSSLKHRQEYNRTKPPARSRTMDDYQSRSTSLRSSPSGMEFNADKDLSRKKSILKLASIVTGNKKQDSTSTNSSSSTIDSEPEKLSIRDKPLPEPPRSPDIIPLRDNSTCNNKKPKVLTKKKRKSAVVMEKTAYKRKSSQTFQSIYDAQNVEKPSETTRPGLTRSKSAFIKLGGGLKSKKSTKYVRKISSAKEFNSEPMLDYKKNESAYSQVEPTPHNFVKRMASFMKSRASKPVEI